MKKLTEAQENELFELHRHVFYNSELRSHAVTLYMMKVRDLSSEGYDVKDHVRFCYYYHSRILKGQDVKPCQCIEGMIAQGNEAQLNEDTLETM